MNCIKTKYAVGDVVYLAQPERKQKRLPCPDCLDTRKWKAISPVGTEYSMSCPRCSTRYRSDHRLCLDYSEYVAAIRTLTIGSVRVDTYDDDPVTYMAQETGVGSGYIHKERDLYATREEAAEAAEVMARAQNINPQGNVLPLYNERVEFSDYQLKQVTELPKPRKKRK